MSQPDSQTAIDECTEAWHMVPKEDFFLTPPLAKFVHHWPSVLDHIDELQQKIFELKAENGRLRDQGTTMIPFPGRYDHE